MPNPKMEKAKKYLGSLALRIWKHLGRPSARIPIFGIFIFGLLVVNVKPNTRPSTLFTVLLGILVTVVLLPETPYKLWNVQAQDLSQIVPEPKLYASISTIANAIEIQAGKPVPVNVVERLTKSYVDNLAEILSDVSKVVVDLTYNIELTVLTPSSFSIDTYLMAKRQVPEAKDKKLWISFCANHSALLAEFEEHSKGCVSREIVEPADGEDLESWSKRIEEHASAALQIGAQPVNTKPAVLRFPATGVVRFVFDAPSVVSSFETVVVKTSYPVSNQIRVYPVKFSNYYAVGETRVSFRIKSDPKVSLTCDHYFRMSSGFLATPTINDGKNFTEISFTFQSETLLQPGSGAVFSWGK